MKKLPIYILIILLLTPISLMAQNYKLLEPLPCIEGTGNNCVSGKTISEISLETYIGYVFKFAIAISAFLAVIMIIWGGFEIMLSEAIPLKMEGRDRIKNAIFGLIMVLSSYLILRTIDPRLVEINTSIPAVNSTRIVTEFKNSKYMEKYDLSKFSAEAQREVARLESENENALARISEIENKDGERTAEESLELEKLKQSLDKNYVSIQSTVAKQSGSIDYDKVLNIMSTKDQTDDDKANLRQYYDPQEKGIADIPDEKGNLPIDTPNAIQNQYNDKINKIKDSDPEQAQILANQRDFYMQAVKETYEIGDKIRTNGDDIWKTPNSNYELPSVIGKVDNTQYLKRQLEIEKNKLNDKEAIREEIADTGVSEEEYKRIIETRIQLINGFIEKQ